MGFAQTENLSMSATNLGFVTTHTKSLANSHTRSTTDHQQEPEPIMNMQLPMASNQPVLHSQRVAVHRAASGSSTEKSLRSDDLLQGHKAVAIEHNGALYRLQSTKLGKLILTK